MGWDALLPAIAPVSGGGLFLAVVVYLHRSANELQRANISDLRELMNHHRERAEACEREIARIRAACTCGAAR